MAKTVLSPFGGRSAGIAVFQARRHIPALLWSHSESSAELSAAWKPKAQTSTDRRTHLQVEFQPEELGIAIKWQSDDRCIIRDYGYDNRILPRAVGHDRWLLNKTERQR